MGMVINEATNELIRCRDEYGFRGAMLNGDWEFVHIGADYFDPYLLMCEAWGWPVSMHTGSYPECEPGLVIPLAERFPKLNFILGHLGYDMIFDAITAATLCPNVYLETSANAPAAAVREAIKRCGAHKLIFGSGLPYEYPDHAAAKVEQLSELSDADRQAIFGGTMLDLLSQVRE